MGTKPVDGAMAISEVKLRNLKPKDKAYQDADGGGLFVEVLTSGGKSWRLRYRSAGKQEKVTLGEYPTYSLAEARQWRTDCTALVKRGLSPMALKRGDAVPDDAKPEAKELADAFLKNWCRAAVERKKTKDAAIMAQDTVEAFARRWYAEIVEPANRAARVISSACWKRMSFPLLAANRLPMSP